MITIIDFSPRGNGNCTSVRNIIAEFYNRTDVRQYKVTADIIGPCANCNYECLTPGVICPLVSEQQKEIMCNASDSELVYFIVPNFCGYPNANYFAFNERSVGFFNMDREAMKRYMNVPKRFVVISNTESDQFKNAMKLQTNGEPDILYLKTSKYKVRSTAGDLMDCDEARVELIQWLGKPQIG